MPTIFSICTKCVFKSFKKFEKWADKITGKVGPLFISLACILILGCAITFFDVVYPHRFLHPDTSYPSFILGTIFCFYMVNMFSFHYYKAITTRPGSPLDPIPSLSSSTNSFSHSPTSSSIPIQWNSFIPSALCIGPLKTLLDSGNNNNLNEDYTGKRNDNGNGSRKKNSTTSKKDLNEIRNRKILVEGGELNVDDDSRESKVAREERNQIDIERVCKKCLETREGKPPKPERTHHCSICKRCVLKYDHHCPWINQCVGLNNERYFLLFLCYFSVSCICVAVWGWEPVLATFDWGKEWNYLTPKAFTLLLWVLTLIMAFAVGLMAAFQIWLILLGESAVESHDNDYYRKISKSRGTTFKNPYHLGWKLNLKYFFNIGPGRYHWITIFLPISIPPSSNGWNWEKIKGWEEFVLSHQDELTDEEEGTDDDEE